MTGQRAVPVLRVKHLLLAGATCSSHLTPELLELTAIKDILVWIHKVYIDTFFFVCARNPIEMNFADISILRVPFFYVTSRTAKQWTIHQSRHNYSTRFHFI